MKLLPTAVMFGVSTWVALCQDPVQALYARYQKELEQKPNSSSAHYSVAELFSKQKNYQSAANEFRAALTGDRQPEWIAVWSHLRLGEIFLSTGQPERAVTEFQNALSASMNAGAKSGLAPTSGPYEPIERTAPEYSYEASVAGLEGVVLVEGVLTGGTLRDIRVTRSLGLGLDEKAIAVVEKWRFAPQPQPVPVTLPVDFALPLKQSRWHLVRVRFDTPDGAARPAFLTAHYPLGPGVARKAIEQGQIIVAMRRNGTATMAFDIDETGTPVRFQILGASDDIWASEATSLVSQWRFVPGTKDGRPVSVPCTMTLAWGEKNITATALAKLSEEARHLPSADYLPGLLNRSEALYTPAARQAGLEGRVLIAFNLGTDGVPRDLKVARSLGLGLDENAMDAVSKWRFRPILLNGREEPVQAVVEVNFRLP